MTTPTLITTIYGKEIFHPGFRSGYFFDFYSSKPSEDHLEIIYLCLEHVNPTNVTILLSETFHSRRVKVISVLHSKRRSHQSIWIELNYIRKENENFSEERLRFILEWTGRRSMKKLLTNFLTFTCFTSFGYHKGVLGRMCDQVAMESTMPI